MSVPLPPSCRSHWKLPYEEKLKLSNFFLLFTTDYDLKVSVKEESKLHSSDEQRILK